MNNTRYAFFVTGLSVLLAACEPQSLTEAPKLAAERVFINGEFYSPGSQPFSAMAISNGKIVYTGDEAGARQWLGEGSVLQDLAGRFAMPGINDAHSHPFQGGMGLVYNCDFSFDSKPAQVQQALTACLKKTPGVAWLEGGQWTSDFFKLYEVPSPREFLDQVSTEVAIYLEDDSGHNAWVNTKALALVGIDRDSADPKGGTIVRDSSGAPNGLLLETAAQLVAMSIPERSVDEYAVALKAAIAYANSFGITATNEARTPDRILQAYHQLDSQGELNARVNTSLQTWFSLMQKPFSIDHYIKLREQYRSDNVDPSFIKIFSDGVPTASRSALMLADYQADEDHLHPGRGSTHLSEQQLREVMLAIDKAGFTATIHTAGDGSVRMALNAIEAVRQARGNTELAHRLAHAGYIDPSDIPRFVQLNVIADFSPFIWFPSPIIDSVLGAVGKHRGEQYWPTRTLLDAKVRVLAGSDWPSAVESPNPWPAIEALISRQNPFDAPGYEGQSLWPEQAISLEQALQIFTLENAVAMGIDKQSGSLEVGKSADFIVLDRNLFTIATADIDKTQVQQTWFRGRLVHQANAEATPTVE
ncbi:MAG: amidohydrolase [Cellvibrionaceae bacterium]|nr:amidohydrolase [Cellvibrionaceae bacterium]